MGTYHAYDHLTNRAMTINFCLDDCNVFQEEVNKHEYYDCRWQENEDEYTVFDYEICFCTRLKMEDECHGKYSSCEDFRESEG